jgi:hypothetical protein
MVEGRTVYTLLVLTINILNTSRGSALESVETYIKRGMRKLTISAYIDITFTSISVRTYSYIVGEDLI